MSDRTMDGVEIEPGLLVFADRYSRGSWSTSVVRVREFSHVQVDEVGRRPYLYDRKTRWWVCEDPKTGERIDNEVEPSGMSTTWWGNPATADYSGPADLKWDARGRVRAEYLANLPKRKRRWRRWSRPSSN